MSTVPHEGSQNAPRSEIVVPRKDYVLQLWRAKAGAVVRIGETIAVACPKDAKERMDMDSAASNPASGPQESTHKRPNRRRRVVPTAAAVAATNKPAGRKLETPSASTDTMASLQQRLAGKLSSDKKVQGTSGSSIKADQAMPEASNSKETSGNIPIHAPATGILHIETGQGLVVGFVEECTHPAILPGTTLCVVCGSSVSEPKGEQKGGGEASNYEVSAGESEEPKSTFSQVTVSGGFTMTVSEQESREMAKQETERLQKQSKLALVLDLDHTLVHATADPRAQPYLEHHSDVRSLRLPMFEGMRQAEQHQHHGGMWMQHFIKLRPYIKEFLELVQPNYELTVYTAGTRQYAEEVTIVLCRYLVGSRMDVDGLEWLRAQVREAEQRYQAQSSQDSIEAKPDPNSMEVDSEVNKGDTKKRKMDETSTPATDNKTTEEPPTKRKRVMFMPTPPSSPKAESTVKAETIPVTKESLQELKDNLAQAEELERKAIQLRKRVFGSRVISRTDVGDLGRDVKSLKRIFPGGGSMAAVVDDREDVWANAADNTEETAKGEPPDNLLLVRPYHWQPFLGFADVNNAAGVDLSGMGPSSDKANGDAGAETDVQLQWTAQILQQLHRRYYAQDVTGKRKTVPEILAKMRGEVLRGTTLVLSGLVPLHKQVVRSGAPRPTIVRYAQSLGCMVSESVQPGVTHVVAAKDGTDKALAARKTPGCNLVKAGWLVECFWSLTRRDEDPHRLGPGGPKLVQETQSNEKVETSDSEDDDLAAAFEEEMMD